MQLKLAKTLWGVPEADDKSQWDELFRRIKEEGFSAIEVVAPFWRTDPPLLRELLDKHGLELICQLHTTGSYIDSSGNYVYSTSSKLEDHVASFAALAKEAAALGPVIINSHSGHDSWGSDDRAVEYFVKALEVEQSICGGGDGEGGKKPPPIIVHETHRQRLLFSPYSTAQLLAKPELRALKINADLSHWCCVCEKVFDANDPRDDWWPATLEAVARHCAFIHCRVGHAEGPQVNDPSAPEHAMEVAAHFEWWRQIWTAKIAASEASSTEATACCWAEPEFGPSPYLQTLPHTNMPVADLWDVNSRVAGMIREEFAKVPGSSSSL